MSAKGFVAVFSKPLTKKAVVACVESWLERFERLEQVIPDNRHDVATLGVAKIEEIIWEENMQFRVINGDEFSWVYVTLNQRVMETTGMAVTEISLCLDVLLELQNVTEIIDDHNDRRLDELEKEGLL